MKVPYEWLYDFLVIDVDPHELARSLTLRGLEVESVEDVSPSFSGVVVGKIKSIEKHPNAENLSVCVIDTGKESITVICGAKNIAEGDLVPLALVGASLADGFRIEQKKLRGIDSFGMLCSEKELGLSDDHSGIFILPPDVTIGQDLAHVPWLSDTILDINVTPNRGDCLSILGIAREAAGILDQKAKLPHFKAPSEAVDSVEERIALAVKSTDACPRYVLKMIEGTTIQPSPYRMRSRISKCGMRPINSLVDVTNYVMLELGQPLHAFDFNRLRDKRIEVVRAANESVFRTLDGVERKLEIGDTLICDGSGPVAIAGIMGGENSEITDTTRDIALESAYFNPLYIRKTARRLGIRSEASLRFEKGIDIDNVAFAADRAARLMQEISGGVVLKGRREVYERREPKSILVSYSNINGLLGTHIQQKEISRALRSIDLHVKEENETGLVVIVPHFRHDIDEPADVIEEISRVHGYEHIPATSPVTTIQSNKKTKKEAFVKITKDYFCSAGFYEVINFAFFSSKDIESFCIPPTDAKAQCVAIMNPISKEYGFMRTFIAPGVLRSVAYNLNRGTKNVRFFEKGKIFLESGDKIPREEMFLCIAMTGRERDYFWKEKYNNYDYFDIKGVVEGLLESFGLTCSVEKTKESFLNASQGADVYVEGTKIGWMGEIREEVLQSYGIEENTFCAELSFDSLLQKAEMALSYKPIPRFPQVTRDFSFFVDDEVPIATIVDKIKHISPLVVSVGVFDVFKKETRSVALRVVFQSLEDTLNDESISNLQNAIIQALSNTAGISLRA